MPVIPAALLVAVVAFYYVVRTSTKVPSTVTFANPTTVIPAATAVAAVVLAVVSLVVAAEAELSGIWFLVLPVVIGGMVLAVGGTTTGSRVVYDRGGVRVSPGKLIGVALFAVFCFVALIQ